MARGVERRHPAQLFSRDSLKRRTTQMPCIACILSMHTATAIARGMSTVEEIEDAVKHISPKQYESFRKWFQEYESDLWARR